jgi:hypothetical protein
MIDQFFYFSCDQNPWIMFSINFDKRKQKEQNSLINVCLSYWEMRRQGRPNGDFSACMVYMHMVNGLKLDDQDPSAS